MSSRPDELRPVESVSDEERRKLIRALVAGDYTDVLARLIEAQRALDEADHALAEAATVVDALKR